MPAAGRYRAIFGTPHVAPLLAASMLAPLPIAMSVGAAMAGLQPA